MTSRKYALASRSSRSTISEVQRWRGPTPNGRTDARSRDPASRTSGSGSSSGPRTSSMRSRIQSGVNCSSPASVEWNSQTSDSGASIRTDRS
ncbi:hypothetical protein BRC66_00265 [Halobacteriales archaeon QH_2_66_30]|nr:MAG: hypothetical protein BRC66_00265 [Halobacteriales archaeon QH_2_66_30]